MSTSAMIAAFWGTLAALIAQMALTIPNLHDFFVGDINEQLIAWLFIFLCIAWIRFFLGVALMSYDIPGAFFLLPSKMVNRLSVVGVQAVTLFLLNLSIAFYADTPEWAKLATLVCAVLSLGYLVFVVWNMADAAIKGQLVALSDNSGIQYWTAGLLAFSLIADVLILMGVSMGMIKVSDEFMEVEVVMFSIACLFLVLICAKAFVAPLKRLLHETWRLLAQP